MRTTVSVAVNGEISTMEVGKLAPSDRGVQSANVNVQTVISQVDNIVPGRRGRSKFERKWSALCKNWTNYVIPRPQQGMILEVGWCSVKKVGGYGYTSWGRRRRSGGTFAPRTFYNANYYLVTDVRPTPGFGFVNMEVTLLDETSLVKALKSTQAAATQQQANVPDEIDELYAQYINATTAAENMSCLAKLLGAADRCIRIMAGQNKLPTNAPDIWEKVKKLRARAAHPTTPEPEKETCLRFAVGRIESMLLPELKGTKYTMQTAISLKESGTVVATATPQVSTSQPPPSRRAASAGGSSAPDLEPYAKAIAALFDPAGIYIKQGANRVTIFYDQYKNGSQNFITITGTVRTMRLYSPFLSSATCHGFDGKGFPYAMFKNPIPAELLPIGNSIKLEFEGGATPWAIMNRVTN